MAVMESLLETSILSALDKTTIQAKETLISLLDEPQNVHLQTMLLSQLSHLRSLQRNTTSTIRNTKAQTAAARSDVDSLHLTLQNLLYEQSHLRAEIEACESYNHPYRELPIEPLDIFLANHPDIDQNDDHAITLARLHHEREQREELEKERLALLKRKQALVKENLKRKEDLQGLDVRMEGFIDAARPIEKVLGLGVEENKDKEVKDVAKDGAAKGEDTPMG